MGEPSEQVTSEELREGVASLARRLERHLNTWESGDQDAMFDVAAVTRTLLANGKGDKAVARLCSQERVEPPRVWVRYPTPLGKDVPAAFGGFPCDRPGLLPRNDWLGTLDPGYGIAKAMPAIPEWSSGVEMSISDWLQTKFFRIDVAPNPYKQVTWERLVAQYGNAYGSHLGVSHPAEIAQIRLFSGHGRKLTEHGLWLAATTALNAASEVLRAVGIGAPNRRRFEHPVASICGLAVQKSDAGIVQQFAISFGSALGKVQLLSAPFADKVLNLEAERTISAEGKITQQVLGYYR